MTFSCSSRLWLLPHGMKALVLVEGKWIFKSGTWRLQTAASSGYDLTSSMHQSLVLVEGRWIFKSGTWRLHAAALSKRVVV